MPRGRKKKNKVETQLKPEFLKSFIAIALIVFSGVVFISFFAPEYSINSKIQDVLSHSFGYGAILFPLITLLIGLMFIESFNFRYKKLSVLVGLILLLVLVSSFFHLGYFTTSAEVALDKADSGSGGGFLGFAVSQVLVQTISIYGAVLVLLATLLLSVILILNITLSQLLSWLSSVAKTLTGFSLPKLKGEGGGNDNKDSSESFDVSTGYADSNVSDTNSEATIPQPVFNYDDIVSTEDTKAFEPQFEIIPAPSEPVSSDLMKAPDVSHVDRKKAVPSLPYSDKMWVNPPVDLLHDAPDTPPDAGDVNARKKVIVETLRSFGISVEVKDVKVGTSVTQYSLEAEGGTRIAKITNLHSDLALALASPTGTVRIEAPIPGKSLIGIEVPNNSRSVINFKDLLISDQMKGMKSKIGIALGRDVAGSPKVYDIAKMPHLLVAGATGSGKSVFLHSIIFSLLYRAGPNEVKFIMIDPKRVELVHYKDIPHLMTPVVTDIEKAPAVFKWAVAEMDKRYKMFESAKVRNIEGYNEKSGFQVMPYIVLICDELAEIMVADPNAVEKSIIRLGQLARATGIHLVLAVQRPSTDILTGLIKANIPARVAFNVTSQIDSRVIIDQPGAEKLLGKGDMLFVPPDVPKPVRIQGAYIRDKEIAALVSHLKGVGIAPDYNEEIFNNAINGDRGGKHGSGSSSDELYDEAYEIVVSSKKASTSYLQRRLSIGYGRAAKILDELEANGVIGSLNGSKGREVLVKATEQTYDDLDIPNDNVSDEEQVL